LKKNSNFNNNNNSGSNNVSANSGGNNHNNQHSNHGNNNATTGNNEITPFYDKIFMEVVALSNFGKELSWEVDEVLSKQIIEKTKAVILATKQLQASIQAYKLDSNHIAVVKEMKTTMYSTNALYTLISEISESGNHEVSIPTLNKLIENFKNALSALGVFLRENINNKEQSKENIKQNEQPKKNQRSQKKM